MNLLSFFGLCVNPKSCAQSFFDFYLFELHKAIFKALHEIKKKVKNLLTLLPDLSLSDVQTMR